MYHLADALSQSDLQFSTIQIHIIKKKLGVKHLTQGCPTCRSWTLRIEPGTFWPQSQTPKPLPNPNFFLLSLISLCGSMCTQNSWGRLTSCLAAAPWMVRRGVFAFLWLVWGVWSWRRWGPLRRPVRGWEWACWPSCVFSLQRGHNKSVAWGHSHLTGTGDLPLSHWASIQHVCTHATPSCE